MGRSDRRRRSRFKLFTATFSRTSDGGEATAPVHDEETAVQEPTSDVVAPPESEPAKKAPAGQQPRTMPAATEEEPTSGWRTSRRSSRTGKQARRQAKAERVRGEVDEKVLAVKNAVTHAGKLTGTGFVAIVVVVGILWGAAVGINAFARWNARRIAEANASKVDEGRARENIVIIGVKGKQAIGFVGMKAERSGNRVLGIAIPDGAFVEVPGQGFERVADSYSGGPAVSRDTVSNFLLVPFKRYLVVDESVYQALITQQRVEGLAERSLGSDMSKSERSNLDAFLKNVKSKDVWIVPLPVRPIAVGDERYYEPQRTEIADIVMQWWGVHLDQQKQALRLIVYNGVGTPGTAGRAAQQLIRAGFRIVDSKNAANFDYKQTQILLYHGTEADARVVRDTLGGVGEIIVQSTPQNVADMIVIVGADYVPPVGP